MPYAIEARTLLAFIVPVGVDSGKIGLAETGHERDLPEDGLLPRPDRVDVYAAPGRGIAACILVRLFLEGLELNVKLLGLEAVRGKIVEVGGRKVRARPFEPHALVGGEDDLMELCSVKMTS